MTDTLRDRLAAVLGEADNDALAYEQADAVLYIFEQYLLVERDEFETMATVGAWRQNLKHGRYGIPRDTW